MLLMETDGTISSDNLAVSILYVRHSQKEILGMKPACCGVMAFSFRSTNHL